MSIDIFNPPKVFRPNDPADLRGRDSPCRVCDKTRRDAKGARFAVCSGCHVALYCSKKCQRADWPAHKAWCQYTQRQAEILSVLPGAVEAPIAGMPNYIQLKGMLRDFVEAHRPAFSGIFQTKLVLFGGVEKYLASETQICLIPLRYRAPPSAAVDVASCNPALTFLPTSIAFLPLARVRQNPLHAVILDDALEAYGPERERLREAHKGDPDFVDTLLVKFTPHIGPAQVAFFPLYRGLMGRPAPCTCPCAALKAEAQSELESYQTFIEIGMVIREREVGSGEGPVPGYLRQDGAKWVWTPLIDDCRTDEEWVQAGHNLNARVKIVKRRLRAVQPHPN
ncbi:hypothetical protein FKP32DRAFT_1108690 [Trametes sanguinea]|nr:hypothetical protein FKP32DRAFT_1108690 [Trametes sanguinea]